MLCLTTAVAALTLSACSGSRQIAPAEGDMALGAPEGAKVTVVEYASVTCSHCAAWQEEVWPGFKARYVDTNKVRYVFREFPTAPQAVAVAGFLIARCAGERQYFQVIDQVMASQEEWRAGTPPSQSLQRIATSAGLNDQQFRACVSDRDAIAAMDERIKAGLDAGVTGTPTFFVNGVKIADSSLAALSAAIDPLLEG
ncbi:DsbA family protein [Brevundimonas sp.]|uniref:DsbA family protein n=1 Tax=Brevundimonas sp. TaxID=1871086 RepID=UPI0025C49831|nr:DsbA family protein [Brevundimonas sp.]